MTYIYIHAETERKTERNIQIKDEIYANDDLFH